MNANQIREMKIQVKEMQTIIDEASNTKAGEMLATMNETRQAYTATELSDMTEGVLSPAQVTAAIRAIERLKFGRNRDGRPSNTKYSSARNFTQFDVRCDVVVKPTYSIQCDEFGTPIENAPIKKREKSERTYQLIDGGNNYNNQLVEAY